MDYSNYWIYDIETYPNVFLLSVENAESDKRYTFEISNRVNQCDLMLKWLSKEKIVLVGFNNLHFDYPVLHWIMRTRLSNTVLIYEKAKAVIESGNDNTTRWAHTIWPKDRYIEQLDLFKIHHFDNKAKTTSLKALEFTMRSESIEELPFKPGSILTDDNIDTLITYNKYDVNQTKKFFNLSKDEIEYRNKLNKLYNVDFSNYNNIKIGTEYFIMKLKDAGVQCYTYTNDDNDYQRKPKQTIRDKINLKDAILPWIDFVTPEFNRVLDWLKNQTITETKGVLKDLCAYVGGIEFKFGTGGLHGSVENKVLESTDELIIEDVDVESYYPSTAIAQRFKPAHYPDIFCDIYASLKEQRKQYPKSSPENRMFKDALNGVFGSSNEPFSVFYDPLMTMSITLNGQLLLCKLVEMALSIKDLKIIQVNTDGITLIYPRKYRDQFVAIVNEWESLTKLKMESNEYSKMFIRDVNNYVALYTNGKIKQKGDYSYTKEWYKDHSALIVPKVTEKVLLEGVPIRKTIESWSDVMDFMIRAKIPKSGYLSIEKDKKIKQVQNVSRFIVVKDGYKLAKWLPPLKSKPEWRRIGICEGWQVEICNKLNEKNSFDINYDYYVNEVEKLCLGLA